MTYNEKSVRVLVKQAEGTPLPQYQTSGASGFDLHANEDRMLGPMEIAVIQTTTAVAVPEGYELQVRSRSGLAAKKSVFVLNSPGTVDSDYRAPIGVILANLSKSNFHVAKGDRIAQAVICPVIRADLAQVEELSSTERGNDGFGSTGM